MSILLLGCGFMGMAAGCESVLFSTAVVYALSKFGKGLVLKKEKLQTILTLYNGL